VNYPEENIQHTEHGESLKSKTELLGKENQMQCHFPPQTPHGLEWDRNRDPAEGGESTDDFASYKTYPHKTNNKYAVFVNNDCGNS
jgi:hypothetical protein